MKYYKIYANVMEKGFNLNAIDLDSEDRLKELGKYDKYDDAEEAAEKMGLERVPMYLERSMGI